MAIGWIRLDVHMPEHPKSRRLAKLLDERGAWRYVVQLWVWAAKHAEDGVLPGDDLDIIAEECGWTGEPSAFIDALVASGWIDRRGDEVAVHDWDEFQGSLVERRAQARRRMRRLRARRKGAQILTPGTGEPSDASRAPSAADRREPSPGSGAPSGVESENVLRERSHPRTRAGAPLRSVTSRSVPSGYGGESEGSEREDAGEKAGEPSDFERLWAAYPRKQRRRRAEDAWAEVRDLAPPVADLVDAVKLWRRTEQWTIEGGRFVPSLDRWLTEQRWIEQPVISGPHFDGIPETEIRSVLSRIASSLDWRSADG